MSNSNTALALVLGAGGGFCLWYFLRDEKKALDEKTQAVHEAAPTNQAAQPVTAPVPNVASPTSPPSACTLRLDPSGLTADGARVTVADAVTRCKTAGRADVTIIKDAPAAAYADLMIALGRAGVPTNSHRNGAAPRRSRRRSAQSADSVDLFEFASVVLALADKIDEAPNAEGRARGRFGRKVFIAAIRRALHRTKYAGLTCAAVDELLLRAHRAGLLELARADFVAAMDSDEVADSQIIHPAGAEFHFVVAERVRNCAEPLTEEEGGDIE